MNNTLKETMHRELDILIAAMERYEDLATVCCPTVKILSEKMLSYDEGESETFAAVSYESELSLNDDGSYNIEARYKVNNLYDLGDTYVKGDAPYVTEITEILDDGTEGGVID